ncbi:DinB family protein [Cohnella thailandensis]|uniref:DinB family protein n=1 Tax=Cohnella thailandensis TaxID=557557 RepID=A0A841SS54_9BACL|nr:DinB family protein [Cohnella thailandensis]MBB6633789.1 DinB family protein [Cohnella thailandensis]MBP1976580.1 putative damage-inducible protein DinB [Cohnella thailandensis]
MSLSELEIARYLNTHDQLQAAIADFTPQQLKWKEAANKWSIAEVLTHLADHNIVVSFRIREILSGSAERLPAFKQDPWVANQYGNEASAPEILTFYRSLLIYNAQLFRRLSEEDGQKTAVNAKGDTVKLNEVVRSFVEHVQHHLGQIDRIKLALSEASDSVRSQ